MIFRCQDGIHPASEAELWLHGGKPKRTPFFMRTIIALGGHSSHGALGARSFVFAFSLHHNSFGALARISKIPSGRNHGKIGGR